MSSRFYETDRALSEYLLFHYGKPEEVLPHGFGPVDALNFPVRCVIECLRSQLLPENARALDLGCALGRSAFELARNCGEVIGIDASLRFIQVAEQLQANGRFHYAFRVEGDITQHAIAEVPVGIERQRVSFEQGDALALRSGLGSFDVVHMANLIDRLSHPVKCFEQLPALVKPGGQLILTSPCTWLDEFTPRKNWLGGIIQDGDPVPTLKRLQELLAPYFTLEATSDLPFLIREHARKFQWSVAMACLWLRNEK